MNVQWVGSARDDIQALVPKGLRAGLRDKMRSLMWVRQGMRCQNERYGDCHFVHYRQWLVMYLPLAEDEIAVVGVEYNYGAD